MKQLRSFIIKEFLHISRDRRTMAILLGIPIILMVLFGFAISNEVKNVRVGLLAPVVNNEVHNIVDALNKNEYFTVTNILHTPEDIHKSFQKNEIDIALVFSPDFAKRKTKGESQIQIVADASDPNKANLASGYATRILIDHLTQTMSDNKGVNTTIKLLYNPQMKSSYNFVPGVMGMLLMLLCAMMTSISIVREKEMGTMEILLASPMQPIFIIIAKMIPYLILSFVNLVTILLLSVFVLNVPVVGHLPLLILSSILFATVALCLGLLISTLANKQIEAMVGSVVVLLLPTVLMSGMIFPVENMPKILQYFAEILPVYWYIDLVRKVMIEGLSLPFVLQNIGVLFLMGAVLIVVSFKLFKNRLA